MNDSKQVKQIGIGQFSLRALLIVIFVVAAMLGVWRIAGNSVSVSVFLVALTLAPLVAWNATWKTAYALSWSAMYGPFAIMSTYTLMFVSCSHCKEAVWTLLPCAPGVIVF